MLPYLCRTKARMPNSTAAYLSMRNGSHRMWYSWPEKQRDDARHSELNQILKQSLGTINIPSTLEPTLFFKDEKRPDGVTLTAFTRGQPLTADVTCQTHVTKACTTAGFAAEEACRKKHKI